MLDRIDIHIAVPRVDYEKLSSDRMGESSASIRERVPVAMLQLNLSVRGYH
jgi:magnesium chelatase family protein